MSRCFVLCLLPCFGLLAACTSGSPAVLEADVLALGFGEVAVGDSSDRTVVIRNASASSAQVDAPSIEGDDAADFQLATADFPVALDPGAQLEVTIVFTPSSVGTRVAVLAIGTGEDEVVAGGGGNSAAPAPGAPLVVVALAGTGIAAGADDDSAGAADDSAGDDDDSTGDDDTAGDDDSAGDDDDSQPPCVDTDGDGWCLPQDCDDSDAEAHPEASESCDGSDNDCDGSIDENDAADASTWYGDSDGDGYGGSQFTALACQPPAGYVSNSDDCDDLDPASYPGAPELCDEADNDCDTAVDEDVQSTFFTDADGDGYGDPAVPLLACALPGGASANDLDCDDSVATSNPAAWEICDGVDNDCDSSTDEADAIDALTWYTDADGDGYGLDGSGSSACIQPTGSADQDGDCDDGDASIYPGAAELCDGVDRDCNGSATTVTWYLDGDGDGYGDPGTSQQACTPPPGYSANALDCDDGEPSAHPGGIELCDGLDNDCNGPIDDAPLNASTWFSDTDGDGFGVAGTGAASCTQPPATANNSLDCDDSDSAVFPGNTELCDAVDNNCNGSTDEGFDQDGDGFTTCGLDGILSTADDDCDDSAAGNFPGSPEVCDGFDNDCNGLDDAGQPGVDGEEQDDDADGLSECQGDCDDNPSSGAANYPGNTEVCDGADNNCDGSIDELLLGSDPSCPAVDCAQVLLGAPGSTTGSYWIDPGGNGATQVSCDMSTDGGGWSLVFNVFDHGSLSENDFISVFGHNLWTTESWNYSSGSIAGGNPNGLVHMTTQGALNIARFDGLFTDLRMTCSQSSNDATEQHFAQVNGYSTINGNWDLLGSTANGTSYAVNPSQVSTGQSTIWHDNEPNSDNSGHYMCDVTNGGSGAAQFGFCYTDFLNSPNSSEYGDSIVAIAFGTTFGSDSWSSGFSAECGDMGTGYLANSGTFSIWVR